MPELMVRPQGFPGRLADAAMLPLMWAVQGFAFEWPQRTHFWNNTKFRNGELKTLKQELMIDVEGDPEAGGRWKGIVPVMHMPILPGGWRKYVVLEPRFPSATSWYIGWVMEDVIGVSRVPIEGEVKILRGPGSGRFFGINAHTNKQVPMCRAGSGEIGSGKHRSVPLR